MTSKPTSQVKYSDFIKLPIEQRLAHAQYFIKNRKDCVPVVLFSRNAQLSELLPSCKFLMNRDNELFMELNKMKQHLKKIKNIGLSESESVFFGYNRKLLNGNVKTGNFYATEFKNIEKDGWMHIEFGKQDIY